MSFDFEKVWASKRQYRQRLATRPIAEKLAMLDALRERQLAIRRARIGDRAEILAEEPAPYKRKPQ